MAIHNTPAYTSRLSICIVKRCIQNNNCNIVPAVYYISCVWLITKWSGRRDDDGDHDDCHDDEYNACLLYNIIRLCYVESTTTVVDTGQRHIIYLYSTRIVRHTALDYYIGMHMVAWVFRHFINTLWYDLAGTHIIIYKHYTGLFIKHVQPLLI